MGAADTEVVLRTIKDLTALYLRQHLTAGGIEVVDPPEEIPSGEEFLRKLPEWTRRAEETAFITDIFKHAARAHQHLSGVCTNVAALPKVTDKTTIMVVINGAVWPLVQLNVPEGFLNPLEDRRAPSSEEEKREKVKKTVLPISDATCLKHEPRNGPTRILTAAVWLKLSRKYFNEGTAKEARERFLVRAKQLSRVLTGRKYLGGTQAHKRKTTDEPPAKHKKTDSSTRHVTTPPLHFSSSHPCIRQATIVKSVPAQIIPLTSFITSRLQYKRHKVGFFMTTPGNHPQLPFPSIPNHLCDSLSHR